MTPDEDPLSVIRATFFLECEDLLELAQDGLTQLQNGTAGPDTIHAVFRAVHSIKGGAGAFGFEDMVALAHAFESALEEARGRAEAIPPERIGLFFRCCDTLWDLLRAARDGASETVPAVSETIAALSPLITDPAASQPPEPEAFEPRPLSLTLPSDGDSHAYRISFTPQAEIYALGNEPLYLLRALAELGTLHCRLDLSRVPCLQDLNPQVATLHWDMELRTTAARPAIQEVFDFVEGLCDLHIADSADPKAALALTSPTPPALPECASPDAARDDRDATLRVAVGRIDRLANLVGELVVHQAMLAQSLREASATMQAPVTQGLEDCMQLTRVLQDSVISLRAQPVNSLFQRMARVLRDTALATGKPARLHTAGANTELDKTVLDRLVEPLTHMIRNAVDHGLEAPPLRAAAGKPAEGRITLTARHRSGHVEIELADDGAGLDRAQIRETALAKGLIDARTALPNSDIDKLLFVPGFSTAKAVSTLSGRGVGMDVVNTAIQSLGGRIAVASKPGAGTCFTLHLPLTLAVLDSMVVRVAGHRLVLPLDMLAETQRLQPGQVHLRGAHPPMLARRGKLVALYDLGSILGFRAPPQTHDGRIVLVICGPHEQRAALLVDALEDQRPVVIKGLKDSWRSAPGITAATILGDGQVALILDPQEVLTQLCGADGTTALQEAG